ncbi:MAG: DUF4148 domain-containing protein [Janthinobacterium lividum]
MSSFRRSCVQYFSASFVVVVTGLASASVLAQAVEAAPASSQQASKAQKKAQRKADRQAAKAKNKAEVSVYEKNGFSPSNKDLHYPNDLQKAQKKIDSQSASPASAP